MKRVAIIVILTIATVVGLSCKRGPASVKTLDYITDDAKVIDESSRKQLETIFATLKAQKSIDFAVVTVKTTGEQSARDYSLALARQRKASSNENNVSGLLLLVAVDDRKWHIQISRNLEDKLTNEILTNLSGPMTDSFKEKRYGEGIVKYVSAVIAELDRKLAT